MQHVAVQWMACSLAFKPPFPSYNSVGKHVQLVNGGLKEQLQVRTLSEVSHIETDPHHGDGIFFTMSIHRDIWTWNHVLASKDMCRYLNQELNSLKYHDKPSMTELREPISYSSTLTFIPVKEEGNVFISFKRFGQLRGNESNRIFFQCWDYPLSLSL
jgi:hypothetical protein